MNDAPPPQPEVPQLRTLLLTDLCDSMALVERLGDANAAELFKLHDSLVLELQQRWRGRLIDRSDGLLLLFERPIDGLGFALDYARGLRELGTQRKVELKVRAGLHVGEVLTWRNSDAAVQVGAKPLEVEGLAKPTAARLMTLARPGQILLSAVAESLTHRAARELGERGERLLWKSHGRWRFKGVPTAQEIYEVGEIGNTPLRAPKPTPKAWRDIPLWRRPAALLAEIGLIAAIAVGAWFVTRPQPAIAFAERDWVVVGDLRNLTGETVLDDSLEQAFRISLEQSRYVNLLSDMKTRDTLVRMRRNPETLLDRAVASEIAIRDGARAVILPTVSEVGGRVRISAEVIDPHTQTTVYSESVDGSGIHSALTSIDKVTAGLRGKLGEAFASIEKNSAPLPQVTTKDLDALRSYALGQKAYDRSEYGKAQEFYAHAVELDPSFALAYIGQLRAHNAVSDLKGGEQYLRKALQLRSNLAPRDQMYLDAWAAEMDAPQQALEKWQQMAAMYPSFFQASANAGYALYARNRFKQGLESAAVSVSPKYEFSGLSWDLMGRMYLALDRYADARAALLKAGAKQGTSASIRLGNTSAAQRNFKEATSLLDGMDDRKSVPFDKVTLLLDQGQWEDAESAAENIVRSVKPDSLRGRAALYPLAVAKWMSGDDRAALRVLNDLSVRAIDAAVVSDVKADAVDDTYAAISAGIMAQRLGDRRIAQRIISKLEQRADLKNNVLVVPLYAILEAGEEILGGDPGQAIRILEARKDGSEPFRLHEVLARAYALEGDSVKALNEARWLTNHRGFAYSELGCGWCQQALNVVDTTLGHLLAAELLASSGQQKLAEEQLHAFDASWKPSELPHGLRGRRGALLSMFK
ncbi:putative peptide modification system cyclase [Xanthomonas campestris pv. phormiicola]|nr:putative peptide modification system cyclase [Xanthomonas campestris pv. phormiicola]UYC16244.1 putative peptide modification system cyclase [Xanthomonas campestris pv. phormiicola]